jgi:TDG/mug DNA glycosylase family protein
MLDDLLTYGLDIVFCGTAVGNASARSNQYYDHPSNKFWKVLREVKLTPVQLEPPEYKKLLEYKIGLTDLAKGKSGMDKVLSQGDYDVDALLEKIKTYQPRYLCFNGKKAAKVFLSRRKISNGLQAETVGDTKIFVAPSTSGRALEKFWDVEIWRELARLVERPA